MAGPLRFRMANDSWSRDRVRRELLAPLDDSFGATMSDCVVPGGFEGCRIDMGNGDIALFCWRTEPGTPHVAYWLGNTVTPEPLWRTEKVGFEGAPDPLVEWATELLLEELYEQSPWLESYEHLSWFFLPVLLSKDGRESTRSFFSDHAAGFPDAEQSAALSFYDGILETGILDPYRETMAGKVGTSSHVDLVRMSAAMSEFTVAKLLNDAEYAFVPEVELDSGYALDFRVPTANTLVEVTRPLRPEDRSVDTPIGALKQTAGAKTDDQLAAHPDALLFVDCSSFRDDEWNTIRAERPAVSHQPAVIFRARPNGAIEGYPVGELPLNLDRALLWLTE
ncbi:DUF5784 family protein [Halocatena halophila]|uniref:DUF5784 family protein n=1 Tax=Halocatena halophila TaxID=2814576 RepID=UPI002ED1B89D